MNQKYQQNNDQQRNINNHGFTLIEMAAVIGIIVLVSSILYANYHDMNKQGDAIGFNEKMVNDFRKVQNNSLKRKGLDGQAPGGWGVKIDNTADSYTIFADFDGDKELSTPVKLLIHGTEWDSGSTFTESSTSAKTVTKYGDATQVSNAGRPANTSGYWSFDGTGDYLSLADNADWDLDGNDFTIDCWTKFARPSNNFYRPITRMDQSGSPYAGYSLFYENRDSQSADPTYRKIHFKIGDEAANNKVISTTDIADDAWHHIAVTRSGVIVRLYIDGLLEDTDTTVNNASNNNTALYIGSNSGINGFYNGYIDDLRIVKGAAMWTHNFTVPNKEHLADIETVKVVNLSKGVNIASLVGGVGAVSPLDLFFSPTDYSTYQDGTVSGPGANVTIGLNDADGITAKTITINPYGLIYSD